MLKNLSYLIVMGVCLFGVGLSQPAKAAKLFLDIDTVFISDGVGTTFDLELRVDEDVQSLKLFVAEINFDVTKLKKVSATEGTFWDTTGAMTDFGCYFKNDSTILRLEGLVLGAGISADGPGLLATLTLEAVDTGMVDLSYAYYSLKDVYGEQIPATAEGSIVFVDYPPGPFNLLKPLTGAVVAGQSGDSFGLIWSRSRSVYPGETVSYELQYGTSIIFDAESTLVMSALADTTYTMYVDNLPQDPTTFFWRVEAHGDLYGFARLSHPAVSAFDFVYGAVPPGDFDLTGPEDACVIDLSLQNEVLFDWEDAGSIIQNDTTKYILYLGPTPSFPGGEVFKDSVNDVSEILVSGDNIPIAQWQYWQVRAVNRFGLSKWSSSTKSAMSFYRGDANSSRAVNISDVTFLIAYLFGIPSGPAPVPSLAGDANCTGSVNISDVAFLTTYLFGIPPGPAPFCP
ncbi:MAG: hypothetical protein OEW00_01680 [candidate division Zixibacteria bacterium]|nr:hypothetical protein [candidate division Zixibacteria bacterium]